MGLEVGVGGTDQSTTLCGRDRLEVESVCGDFAVPATEFDPRCLKVLHFVAPGPRLRKGRLNTAMVTAAIAAGKARGSHHAEKYRRLSAKRGKMRAAVAIAHKILVAAYRMLTDRSYYRELGADYLDRLNHHRIAINLTKRLRAMGYEVQINPKAA